MAENFREKLGLVEAIEASRKAGDRVYLQFLSSLLEEQREAKWLEAGRDHSRWRRNHAVVRARHVVNRDERVPWPLENHCWSLIEGTRPIWGDNPPQVQIVPIRPGPEVFEGANVLRLAWEWASQVGHFNDAWEELFDDLPIFGTGSLKVVWDDVRQAPIFSTVDPRAIFAIPDARLHHRYARILTMVHRVDVGEIRQALPEIADKIQPIAPSFTDIPRHLDLSLGRDTGQTQRPLRGARDAERKAEVVEMWFAEDLLPLEREVVEKAEEEADAQEALDETGQAEPVSILPVSEAPERFLVVTFIPEAGVVFEEQVVTGRQLFTGQFWRNRDSIYGISDVEVIVGLQIAMDQLAIRGHAHRLAMYAPPLINPKTSGVSRRQLSGRPAPILEPTDHIVAEGLKYLPVPGPNREAIDFYLSRPQLMRRILGSDEIRPELFEREQTASGLALLVSALENRLRQKIRNLRPMIHDLVETTLRLVLTHSPQGFTVRRQDGGVDEVTGGQLEMVNLSDYAIVTSLDRPGPLSKQARLAAIERAISMGVLDPSNNMPMVVREMILDELEVPRRDEIKLELRRIAEEQTQQAQALTQTVEQAQATQQGTEIPPVAQATSAEQPALPQLPRPPRPRPPEPLSEFSM